MSQAQPPEDHSSHPATAGGLFLRGIIAVGVIVLVLVGIVWYTNR